MKTLVIHPKDESTDFLKPIYENIENKTVVTGGRRGEKSRMTKNEVHELIKTHDRVIMLGHGCPYGLFSIGKFESDYGLIIDHDTVELLKEKTDNIYIWCNADEFVNRYELKGFYSGMFVSEVGESNYCGVPSKQKVVDESNHGFSKILGENVNNSTDIVYRNVSLVYELLGETNKVAKYNSERLYQRV
jgi:hypothetical protein